MKLTIIEQFTNKKDRDFKIIYEESYLEKQDDEDIFNCTEINIYPISNQDLSKNKDKIFNEIKKMFSEDLDSIINMESVENERNKIKEIENKIEKTPKYDLLKRKHLDYRMKILTKELERESKIKQLELYSELKGSYLINYKIKPEIETFAQTLKTRFDEDKKYTPKEKTERMNNELNKFFKKYLSNERMQTHSTNIALQDM